jgi:hypothetical protein
MAAPEALPAAAPFVAEPVEPIPEVLPVARPASRPAPRPRPRRRREEEDDRDEPVQRRSGGGAGIFVAIGVFVVIGAGGLVLLFGLRVGPSGPMTMPSGPPVEWPGRMGRPAPKPIPEAEFPQVLAELKAKPDAARLADLAARLAVTEPTEEQKNKHHTTKGLEAVKEGAPKAHAEELKNAQEQDDILRVSRALEPLLADPDYKKKMAAAQAMSKWGTEQNVPELVKLLKKGDEGGVVDFRVAVAKALGAIGDPRGIAPVAKRLSDNWDRARGVIQALAAFGPQAESETLKYLDPSDHRTAEGACMVLKEIGTEASLPELDKLASNPRTFFTLKRAADDAAKAIRDRSNKE